jgi:hypothetical protein
MKNEDISVLKSEVEDVGSREKYEDEEYERLRIRIGGMGQKNLRSSIRKHNRGKRGSGIWRDGRTTEARKNRRT